MKRATITIAVVLLFAAGCSDMIVPGMRWAPDEKQKQAAQGADDLAGQLVATGARPGSAASRALARMTRPSTVYSGPPREPIDLESLAMVEAGQWRHKDDQVVAARLRDNLRARAMDITTIRLAALAEIVKDKDANTTAILDQMAAISTVATMADDLADVIPDPRSPDDTRSPEIDRIAVAVSAAVDTIAAAANDAARARPTAGETADKVLDSVDKTVGKVILTAEKGVAIYEKYAAEIIGLLSLAGLGAGGYEIGRAHA